MSKGYIPFAYNNKFDRLWCKSTFCLVLIVNLLLLSVTKYLNIYLAASNFALVIHTCFTDVLLVTTAVIEISDTVRQ